VGALSSEKLAVSVFAKNIKSGTTDSEWQKKSKLEKITKLNEALLRVCLEREGLAFEDEALDSDGNLFKRFVCFDYILHNVR
jgi:hypothetical protein